MLKNSAVARQHDRGGVGGRGRLFRHACGTADHPACPHVSWSDVRILIGTKTKYELGYGPRVTVQGGLAALRNDLSVVHASPSAQPWAQAKVTGWISGAHGRGQSQLSRSERPFARTATDNPEHQARFE
jgi:hypothetical protein